MPKHIKVLIEGMEFRTIKEATEYFSVDYSRTLRRISRDKWNVEDAIFKKLPRPDCEINQPITVAGIEFDTIKEACTYFKIQIHNYRYRKQMGWSTEEIFGLELKNGEKCKGTIYIIKNTVNKKVYIGLTGVDVATRFKAHIRAATRNYYKNYNSKFYKAIRKIGADAFYIERLAKSNNRKTLSKLEVKYINKYNSIENGYNSMSGGSSLSGRSAHPIEYKGKIYGSIQILADTFNMSTHNVLYRLERNIPLEKEKRKRLKVKYRGKIYNTLTDLARELKMSFSTIHRHITAGKLIKGYKAKFV